MNTPGLYSKLLINLIKEINDGYFVHVNLHLPVSKDRLKVCDIARKISNALKSKQANWEIWQEGINCIDLHVEFMFILQCEKLIEIKKYMVHNSKNNSFMEARGIETALLTGLNCPSRSNLFFATKFLQESFEIIVQDDVFLDSFVKTCYELIKQRGVKVCDLENGLFLNNPDLNLFCSKVLCKLLIISFVDDPCSIVTTIDNVNSFHPSEIIFLRTLYSTVVANLSAENIFQLLEEHFVLPELNCNWNNLSLFFSIGFIHSEKFHLNFKSFVQRLINNACSTNNKNLIYLICLLGKIMTLNSSINTNYLNWYSQTFSSESSRPFNSENRAKFFLNCMTDVLDLELPVYLKVYINKTVYVPPSCQPLLSEYLQTAKARLLSLNESTELGIFDNPSDVGSAENDVQCLITSLEKSGNIPQKFLAALPFRKQYYEKTFLNHLFKTCKGKSSKRHSLIKYLTEIGKISKAVFSKHDQTCI